MLQYLVYNCSHPCFCSSSLCPQKLSPFFSASNSWSKHFSTNYTLISIRVSNLIKFLGDSSSITEHITCLDAQFHSKFKCTKTNSILTVRVDFYLFMYFYFVLFSFFCFLFLLWDQSCMVFVHLRTLLSWSYFIKLILMKRPGWLPNGFISK